MSPKHLCVLLFVVAFAGAQPGAKAEVFTDAFEGPTLDPFWYVHRQDSGQVIFPSTGQAHGGSQSLQLKSLAGGDKFLTVRHDFAAPVYGTLSVWMYDGYAGQETNYFYFGAGSTVTSDLMYTGTQDWVADKYFASTLSGDELRSYLEDVDRVNGWHHLEMISFPHELTLKVDGQTLISEPNGKTFDWVALQIFGPSWRPSDISVYWDDFAMNVIPEPSTLALLSIGAMAAFCLCRWRRRAA
jgi:hypothetical protein